MENLDKFNENEEEVTIPLKKEENSNNNKIDEEEFKRKKTKDFSFKQYNNRGLMMLEQKQKLDAQKEKLQDYVIQSKKIVDENEESESHMSDEQIFQLVDDFKKLAEEKKKVSETESDKKEKYHTVGKNNRGRGGRKNVSNDRNETNKRKQEAVEKQSKEKLRKQKEGKPEVQSKEVKEKQKEKEKEKDTREIESFVPMKGMMKTLQVLNGKVKCNKIGVNCMCGNHVGYETSSGLNRITKYGQLRTYGKLLLPKNLPAYQLGIMATIEEQETEVVNSCNFIMLENTQLMITDKYSKFFMAEFFYNIANPSSYLINLKTYYLKEGKLHASTISTFVKCENMLLKKDFVHVIVFNSPSPVTLVNGVSDLPSMKGNIHTETAGKCYTLSWELDETYEMVNDGNEKYGYKIVFTEETRNEKIFSALCELIDMAQESERVKSRKSDDDVIPENILIGVSTISVERVNVRLFKDE